ncbi:MAG: Glycosyl transferase group 1 [Candidatus Amesbacteria bacterium GW2011_GWA2_47_11]|uniref:Glycosyl transferase group 1 n=1 Tax=Candidatus Amesbacteria bacterium GW2011_GWA2_47_11 TaxID=1618357 RepID=A0A0G1RHV4_9BACT|nr:MAG: Glycosyl transferase group 1 [Candidatus Amesbacteria bacterium GW2011_GWA2_47_11]
MRILMLTPYLPYPPSAGGQIRSYNLIKHLSRHHQITLACFTRETNTTDQIRHMEKFCNKVLVFKRGKAWTIPNILRTGFSPYPFLIMIYYRPQVKAALKAEIDSGQYDLIHAETFYVMPYLPVHSVPTVLVEQTIMSRVFWHEVQAETPWLLKPLYAIDVAKIAYWEKYFWRVADKLAAVSEEDAAIIKKAVPQKVVSVIPNGVGDDFDKAPKKLHYNQTIFYIGNYKWMQNWEAAMILATKVFPRQGVVAAYQKSGLLIAPIYGPSGTRLKILAAMASMTPVVTTPIGAEGLGIRDGVSMMIGQSPEQMAQKAIEILKDKQLYENIAQNAKQIADSGFRWEPISKKLETLYQSLIDEQKK